MKLIFIIKGKLLMGCVIRYLKDKILNMVRTKDGTCFQLKNIRSL